MTLNDDSKLYIVEFGKPDGGLIYYSPTQSLIYVIATSYDQAAQKAIEYIETQPTKSVVGFDGSLIIQDEIKVKAVKLATEKIIY